MPERPTVAGKDKVKGYERVGPQRPVPVSEEDLVAVAVVVVVFPARLIKVTVKLAGGAAAPVTWMYLMKPERVIVPFQFTLR